MNSKIFLSLERHCLVEDLKLKSNLKNNQKRLSWTNFFEFLSYIEKTFNLLPTHFFFIQKIYMECLIGENFAWEKWEIL